MSNDRSSPISVPAGNQRRASLAAGLSDYISRPVNPGGQSGSVTNAAAAQNNHRRRLSITTLGLSGSPTQTSPFGGKTVHRGSISSSAGSNSASFEDAVMEDPESASTAPTSPFARRMSFGAQALRDVRSGSISNGRYPSSGQRRPSSGAPTVASTQAFPQNEKSNASRRKLGEGFNWSEALRSRAERAPSLGSVSPNTPQSAGGQQYHQRAASIASMEQPTRELPKQPKQKKPDFFQEKILRGDFMD